MNNFLKKMIEGNGESPPEACLESFNENFSDAVNVDWHNRNTCFEAVFYKGNLGHIAIFNLDGTLVEYRQFLPYEYLPVPLRNIALSKGEVMNSVLKNKGNMIEYEIIVCNPQRKRFMLLISDIGELKEEIVL